MFVAVHVSLMFKTFACWVVLHAFGALTPRFGNGAGAHGIGKISGVLTKIGKFDIVLKYGVSIAANN